MSSLFCPRVNNEDDMVTTFLLSSCAGDKKPKWQYNHHTYLLATSLVFLQLIYLLRLRLLLPTHSPVQQLAPPPRLMFICFWCLLRRKLFSNFLLFIFHLFGIMWGVCFKIPKIMSVFFTDLMKIVVVYEELCFVFIDRWPVF